ncbi:hypothetical protein [Kribbella sp. DT2]|uniref:hypothetical protein n=1 Tax=Kribbella sp. DT2 TaxID=3393427 RepID=UPI003CF71DC7
MSDRGLGFLVWVAAGFLGAVLGAAIVASWAVIYVDTDASDIALYMAPLAAIAGGLIGFVSSALTWLICSARRAR